MSALTYTSPHDNGFRRKFIVCNSHGWYKMSSPLFTFFHKIKAELPAEFNFLGFEKFIIEGPLTYRNLGMNRTEQFL